LTVVGSVINISWLSSANNGSPIIAYTVYIRQFNLVYTADVTTCSSSTNPSMLINHSCSISFVTLNAAPYSLIVGSIVYVRVTATNSFGESSFSLIGSGAVI
jgi:hypothetical protein